MPAASGFDRRGKASWPMRLVIALLFFTIFASRCFAFGAYAVGYDAKRKQFESFLVMTACESSPGIKCFIGEAGCDRAKAFAPIRPPGSPVATAIGTQP